ncbi:Las1-like family protein [Acanthocheilonema viteae]
MNLKGAQVPFTRREWDIVTNVYRSDKASELKHAVALIVSWKARSGDSVHVAADMTEMLLRAIIMDKEIRDDDWFKIGNVKLAYCTAIIRFVNYVNEICQSNYKFKSIASAVSDVGIPQWIVDIRHSATHSYLPSLDSLRQAARYCRDWLWDHHWSRPVAEAIGLNSNIQNESNENEVHQEAIDLIDRFMLFSLQKMKLSARKKKDRTDRNMKLQKVLTKMETFIMMHPWEFLNAFLMEGYLILNEKQAKSIDYNLFAENEKIWDIPEDLQLFWKPIFHYLNEAKMLPELLFQLLETLSDDEMQPIRKRQLIAWSDRMLIAYIESNVLTQSEWERILKAIMLAPKELREAYFEKVLIKHGKMTEKGQDALRQLANLSSRVEITSETSTSRVSSDIATSLRTVEDLQQLMMQKKNEKQPGTSGSSNASSNTHRWSTCNPLEWKGIPLGLTPEQSTESLYLVVELEEEQVRKRHRVT